MAITDLTGTKWVLNEYPPYSGLLDTTFTLNFNSNSNSYNSLYIDQDGANEENYYITLRYGSTRVYFEGVYDLNTVDDTTYWIDSAYRLIEITGGTDATNATLIAWLQANATQVEVTDLTGTTWYLNQTIPAGRANGNIGTKSFNFTSNYMSFIGFNNGQGGNYNVLYYVKENESIAAYSQKYIPPLTSPTWADEAYRTISITSGTDVTNPDLIVWLTNNATYQEPTPTKTFDLTTLNLSVGTHTIKVKARGTGYADSNFSNSVSYTVAASGYEVSITVQNGVHTGDWEYTKIYDDFDEFSPSGNELGSISTANGSTTVRTATGKICVVLQGAFIGGSSESYSSTGGVSIVDRAWDSGVIQYNAIVSADGTLVISGIDFDE